MDAGTFTSHTHTLSPTGCHVPGQRTLEGLFVHGTFIMKCVCIVVYVLFRCPVFKLRLCLVIGFCPYLLCI